MICITDSFYGIHTIKEICDMFEKQPDTDQVVIAKIDDNNNLKHITYFVGQNNSHGIEKYTEFNEAQQLQCKYKDEKVNVIRFYTLESAQDPKMAIVNVIIKDIKESTNNDTIIMDEFDFISVDRIRQKYCWRNDVECVMLHNTAANGGTMALLLNESNDPTSESKNYNDDIVKSLKEKKEYFLVDIKNRKYEAITHFTPLNTKQTKFNVHIYGYFTDFMGLAELTKENENV